MTPRTHIDHLRVTSLRRVDGGGLFAGWSCTRCGEEHAPTSSWWATLADADGDSLTVVLCGACVYRATRPADRDRT